ncbi:hypothetical protein [Diplocloster agilis]|uniref:Uncharacterized protein n=1 Tax=Diplocloster agilis TaxID=2850323 RepID=A0A949K3V7_9FIRM|nr:MULTISPECIES: hypothetical protein [Lachnospiraceae]MBU9738325.1 hypothetical protein [Diplocloster agilis]MBU9746955.1 hypothetical protein [Diplocloster agilis]MCU6734113.1 hypothetical protein [Suonthocola fibrivorans]SCJ24286.1 Uncharacterised protein [uncultured Clostridium sp.]
MIPKSRKELADLVTETTLDVYEDLTPQLIERLEQIKHSQDLSESQKNDEVMLDMMGFVKSCTNEIIIDVLARIFGLE